MSAAACAPSARTAAATQALNEKNQAQALKAAEQAALTRASRAIEAALADKERLKQMAVTARAHVRANHVGAAFCERVLHLALQNEMHNGSRSATLLPGSTDAAR